MPGQGLTAAASLGPGLRAYRGLVHGVLRVYGGLLAMATRRAPQPRRGGPRRVLLTGTFHSHNWIRAHLGPLAASAACAEVTMVTTSPLPELPGVVAVHPPRWQRALFGGVGARLLTFTVTALRTRPDVVGGFHLLINGLVATLVGRAIGAESWYFCVGGITELRDGGVWGENPYFSRLRVPDPWVEARLLAAVQATDLVITMGTSAVDELRRRGITTRIEVVAGGVDDPDFHRLPGTHVRDVDVVLVARLVPIKRIELFLDAVAQLAADRPGLRAAIVGDGPLRATLEAHARALGIEGHVAFAGQHADVRPFLRRARVFCLSSRSEGLALSLMEAMASGVPGVVPRVGDLPDLVEPGVTGELVDDPDAARLADALRRVLDPQRHAAYAEAARQASRRYTPGAATRRWDAILGGRAAGAGTRQGAEDAVTG